MLGKGDAALKVAEMSAGRWQFISAVDEAYETDAVMLFLEFGSTLEVIRELLSCLMFYEKYHHRYMTPGQ